MLCHQCTTICDNSIAFFFIHILLYNSSFLIICTMQHLYSFSYFKYFAISYITLPNKTLISFPSFSVYRVLFLYGKSLINKFSYDKILILAYNKHKNIKADFLQVFLDMVVWVHSCVMSN